MYYLDRIFRLPINKILASGITLYRDRKRNNVQVLLGDNILWSYPMEFHDDQVPGGSHGLTVLYHTWGSFHLRDLYNYLRRYSDTPRLSLDEFTEDFHGLRDILLICDKRRGLHANSVLLFSTNSAKARQAFHYRYRRGKAA